MSRSKPFQAHLFLSRAKPFHVKPPHHGTAVQGPAARTPTPTKLSNHTKMDDATGSRPYAPLWRQLQLPWAPVASSAPQLPLAMPGHGHAELAQLE
jgi:hypothetical protein